MKIELSNGRLEIDSLRFENNIYQKTTLLVEETIGDYCYSDGTYEFEVKQEIKSNNEFLEFIKNCISGIKGIEERDNINSIELSGNKIYAKAICKEIYIDDTEENVFEVYNHNITFDVKVIVDEEVMSKLFN